MLKGIERHNNLLRYEIISPPRHGRLSALDEPDPNRQGPAYVVYAHGDDETSHTDTFSYRVTAPISGRGATGTVTINITDQPPRLGVPSLLELTAVVGETATGVLALTNLGGGILHGEVRVPPPFHIEGDSRVALGRGRSTNITIHFTPLKPGLTPPEKIQPAPRDDPGAAISLVGEGNPPFAVKTTSGDLRLRGDVSGGCCGNGESLLRTGRRSPPPWNRRDSWKCRRTSSSNRAKRGKPSCASPPNGGAARRSFLQHSPHRCTGNRAVFRHPPSPRAWRSSHP